MTYFVVHVEEKHKVLISPRVVKDSYLSSKNQTSSFNDLFENLVQPEFWLREVYVFAGNGDSKWNLVQDGLQDELSLLTTLGFTHIKFVIQPENILQRFEHTQNKNKISKTNIINKKHIKKRV